MATAFHKLSFDSGSPPQTIINKTRHSLVGAIAFDSDNSSDSLDLFRDPLSPKPGHQKPFIKQHQSTTSWNIITITLCITFVLLSTLMPFYNKISLELYTYPITLVFFQVIGVVIVLIITLSIIQYKQNKQLSFQYINSPYFRLECQYLILPSLFFSLNIILTNIGIKLTTIDLHILLRGTEIVWFVLFAPILTKDKPTKQAIIAAIIVTIGAVSLGFSTLSADNISLSALIINILSAFFTPLQIIFLRKATNKLIAFKQNINNNNNMLQLSKNQIVEITCLKMLLSLVFILPAALIVEKPIAFKDLGRNYGTSCNVTVLIIGIIVTLLFQWNVVALTSKVEPILVGTLQQSKGIWIYILSIMVGGVTITVCNCVGNLKCGKDYPACPCFSSPDDEFHGDFLIPHVVGVVAIVLGMIYYTLLKYKSLTLDNN